MEALQTEAVQGRWLVDVLADPDLIMGVRDEYLSVYSKGPSLFEIRFDQGGRLKCHTHSKYLIDPTLSTRVKFDGLTFFTDEVSPLLTQYTSPDSLERLKRAANYYAGEEKRGVQTIIRRDPNVVNVEIAFSGVANEPVQGTPWNQGRFRNRQWP